MRSSCCRCAQPSSCVRANDKDAFDADCISPLFPHRILSLFFSQHPFFKKSEPLRTLAPLIKAAREASKK